MKYLLVFFNVYYVAITCTLTSLLPKDITVDKITLNLAKTKDDVSSPIIPTRDRAFSVDSTPNLANIVTSFLQPNTLFASVDMEGGMSIEIHQTTLKPGPNQLLFETYAFVKGINRSLCNHAVVFLC